MASRVFLVAYAWMTFFVPNYLGHPDNYIEANPLVTPPHIVPEWYFLPFYAILRAIPNKLLGVIALFLSILITAALPWLDTSKVRSRDLPAAVPQGLLGFSSRSASGSAISAPSRRRAFICGSRACCRLYYFLHFLVVLPLIGKVEKSDPVPESIDVSVARRETSHV